MDVVLRSRTRDMITWLAKSQIGVREDPYYHNMVKYNDWYYGRNVGGDGYPWCMVFVCWVFHQAGFNLRKEASCNAFVNAYKKLSPSQIVTKDFKPGDIMFFDFTNKKKSICHTGICVEVGDKGCLCVEGNSGDMVKQNFRLYEQIVCAVRPFYKEV